MKTEHKLTIFSHYDARAECTCGFYFSATGRRTDQEIIDAHNSAVRRRANLTKQEAMGHVLEHIRKVTRKELRK